MYLATPKPWWAVSGSWILGPQDEMLTFCYAPEIYQELFDWSTIVIKCIRIVFTLELYESVLCFSFVALTETPDSIFLYHSRMWYLLKCISPITELLILQTRPVVMSFLDLDLSPSQNEKPFMSPNKLSIKVILSVEYVDYKTPKEPTNLSDFSLGVEIQGIIIVPYSGKDRKMYPRP